MTIILSGLDFKLRSTSKFTRISTLSRSLAEADMQRHPQDRPSRLHQQDIKLLKKLAKNKFSSSGEKARVFFPYFLQHA